MLHYPPDEFRPVPPPPKKAACAVPEIRVDLNAGIPLFLIAVGFLLLSRR